MVDIATTEATTRERTTKRIFVNAEGEESARALPDTVGGRVIFVETDYVVELDFTSISGYNSIPNGVLRQGFAFGVMTSVTNTVGSSKLSIDEKIEACEARWEAISKGTWQSEREGSGPRSNDYLEAAKRVQASSGKPWDETRTPLFLSKVSEDEGYTKTLLKNDAFRAHMDAIKLERAQARAAKSAIKAKDQTDTSFLDF